MTVQFTDVLETLRLCALYSIVTGAAVALAGRLVRRLSRRAALGLVLLPLALTGRAMLTGGFYGPLNLAYESAPLKPQAPPEMRRPREDFILGDLASQIVPWRKAVRESLRRGRLPLWNRFQFAGDILAGASQPAPFHPFVLVGCLLPLATAWTLGCALTFFLAGLGAFLYLRELELSEIASFFGAAVWSFSGFLVFWVGWPVAMVFAPLPLLCLGLRRMARGGARAVLITSAALILILLGGHPESMLHVAAAAGVLFLAELAANRGRALRAIGASLLAGTLAAGIAAPALLPCLEAMPQTVQYHSRRTFYAREKKSTSIAVAGRAALFAVYPTLLQDSWEFQWKPERPPHSEDAQQVFVGGLALALAALGLLSGYRERWKFALLGCFGLAAAVAMPGPTEILNALPLFDIAINWRLSGVAAFCLAVLGAMGLQRVLDRGARLDAWMLAGAAVLFGAGWLWLRPASPAIVGQGRPIDSGAPWLLISTFAFAAVAWGFRKKPRAVGVAAIGIFLVTHLAEMPSLYPTFGRKFFYPRVPELDRLPRAGAPYRIAGLGYSLIPNQATMDELEDARGYQAMWNQRWFDTQPLWSVPMGTWFNRVDEPARPFASFLNIRYFIAEPSRALPAGLREVIRGPSCAIFENPRALPRAFAPETIRFAGPDEPAAEEMRGCEDFAKLAWIDAARSEGPVANGRASVSAREDGPDLRLHIEAASPAWIVASETAWKGWHAREGRRELPIRIANHAFLAFQVPAGSHDVRLTYWPRSFTLGLIACLLTAAGCLTALLLRPRGNSTAPAALTGR